MICGFVPLAIIDDPIAKVINENDVGLIFNKSAKTKGLNPQVWKDNTFEYGIVASNIVDWDTKTSQ